MITTTKERDALEDAIDDILLLCCSGQCVKHKSSLALTPSQFKEAELRLENIPKLTHDGIESLDITDISLKDLPDRWSVSIASNCTGDGDEHIVMLARYRRMALKEVRGVGRLLSPYVMEINTCSVDPKTMRYMSGREVFNWGRGRWLSLGAQEWRTMYSRHAARMSTAVEPQISANFSGLCDLEYTCKLQWAMISEFCRDLQWYVVIKGIEGGFSVRIPTDPQGAAMAFKDRDTGESGRRSALQHWVREHYRRKRVDGDLTDDLIEVCQHLRGRIPFRWRGLDCELIAAPFDVRRYTAVKEQKKARKLERV